MNTRTSIRGHVARAIAVLAAGAAIAMPATAANAAIAPIRGCPSPGQQFANPGFESGNVAWTASDAVIAHNWQGEPSHSGNWLAWLDGYGTTHTDTLTQTVPVLSGCTATLSFWLLVDTWETTKIHTPDTMTVAVNGVTKATYSNLNDNDASGAVPGVWTHVRIVLTGVSDHATVTFTGTEDASWQTSFVIDDTELTLS
jgi:hypothetical protein